MIHKIYIDKHDKLHDIQNYVYYFAAYASESNMNLARYVELPEKYPAILMVKWDESHDVHDLDWEYVYLSDFELDLGDKDES